MSQNPQLLDLPVPVAIGLKQFYQQYSHFISEEIWSKIAPLHKFRLAKKGEILIKSGDSIDWFGMVTSGIFRFYFEKEGKEITGDFFIKGNLVASFAAYLSRNPSRIFIEALEDSSMVVITRENETEIAKILPDYYRVTKLTRDEVYVRSYERYMAHLLDSAEDRYLNFLEKKAELLQLAPQYMIASYLGITPEALSRIRKKISQKHK
jgi:CRP-like cAMP-binding protein